MMRANAWRKSLEPYDTIEELRVAMRSGAHAKYKSEVLQSEWFEQMTDNLILKIQTTFGVPETKEMGPAEKYELWLHSRREPGN